MKRHGRGSSVSRPAAAGALRGPGPHLPVAATVHTSVFTLRYTEDLLKRGLPVRRALSMGPGEQTKLVRGLWIHAWDSPEPLCLHPEKDVPYLPYEESSGSYCSM